ncbi:MAG: carbohydrate ABC transporter permease [Clostridia bacterium]|nr:carbohydrate ABC transporter permease [Clostridia bacterium]
MTKFNKKKSISQSNIISKIVIYTLLAIYAFILLFPFYIILISSLRPSDESYMVPFQYYVSQWDISAYTEILTVDIYGVSFVRSFINTLLYVIPPTLIGLFVSAIAGFAFSKLRFPFKNSIFAALMISMVIPGTVTMIPSFMIFNMLNWVDTPLPLIVPGLFGGIGTIFFMRQYFSGIPNALIEAAKIDGMGYMRMFFSIMVPLSLPVLISFGLMGFVGGFNDYFGPLLYLYSPEKYTLQIALKFVNSSVGNDIQINMAACIITMLPVLILYFFAQKYFVRGIAVSGIKE